MMHRQRSSGVDREEGGGGGTFHTSLGCDKLDARRLVRSALALGALVSSAGAGACGMGYALGSSQAKPLVVMHAEDDLDCPASDLHVEEEWGGRWEAKGCGRRALYNAKCQGIDCQVLPEDKPVPWADRPEYDPGAKH
jgi:hypothetical protein